MDPVFKYALNPEPIHDCIGLRLRPLTLGHVCLLHKIESPLVEPGSRVEFCDILLAVLICSRHHRAAARILKSQTLMSFLGWLLGFRARRLRLKSEIAKFVEYLEDSYAAPDVVKPKSGESKTVGAPLEWMLIEALRSDYQMSERQAMDTPVIVAQCLWLTRSEREHRVQIAGDKPAGNPETLVRYLHDKQRHQNINAN